MNKQFIGLTLLLLGCPPRVDGLGVDTDTEDTGDTNTSVLETVVVATVKDDFSVAALAEVSMDDLSVEDGITTIATDPGIVVEDGHVFVLGRYGFDSIRMYDAGNYGAPEVEFSTGEGSNPQDVALCEDQLFVTLYGEDFIGVYDLEGHLTTTIDLSAYADSDGLPEASGVVEIDGQIYVALNRLDQENGWISAGNGKVIGIDCGSLEVDSEFDVGPNPAIEMFPNDSSRLLVRTGVFYTPSFDIDLDGELGILNLTTGDWTNIMSESTLGANITEIATSPGGAVVLTQDELSEYSVWCLDPEQLSTTLVTTSPSYLADAVVSSSGEAVIAARTSYLDDASQSGLFFIDLATCEISTEQWISTSISPLAVAIR